MTRHLGVGGLCLATAFALLALGAATASASLPAFYQCVKTKKVDKKYVGHYLDKKCSEPASETEIEEGKENKYELEEWNEAGKGGASKVKEFKGKGGSWDWAVEGIVTVTCSKSSDSGRVTGPKTVGDVHVVWKGCEVAGIKFTNTGHWGEVASAPLVGEIGYINKAKHEVGIDLKPESGYCLAEFEDNEQPYPSRLCISGSVIAEIAPINTFTKETTFTFRESDGRQLPEEFEGGIPDTLTTERCKGGGCEPGGSPEPTAFEGIVVNKGEELELKA